MEVEKDTGGVRRHKAEQYLPKIPMPAFDKMTTRANEINYWSEFVESVNSWLALLDDFYPIELYRATVTDRVVRQDSLEKGPAARSARFHHLLRQSLGTFQMGLDVVRQAEQEQLGAACGYEAFRKLNLEFGIQSRMEATLLRETVLAYRPGKRLHRPLDIYRAVEAELLRVDRNLQSYPSVKLSEAEKVMLHFKCMPETCKHYVLLHGKSDTLEQVLESIKFYDSHLRLIGYEKEMGKAAWTEEMIAAFNKGKGKKGKGKGAMDEAPNLEGSIAALLLRVARLEDQLRQMDLPFVEDRLDNMETVVAALQRTIDTLSERFEVLLTLARGLEASIRSLERERRSMLILADRISQLESISRQETQGALECHQIACVIASHALKQHLSSVMIDF